MKRKLIILTTLFVFAHQSNAQINTVVFDTIVQGAVNNDLFEGTVLIAEKGKPIYTKSFGFKDDQKRLAIANTTNFSIASISKLFTAIVVMQLVEEGKIKLSDNLKSLLPDLAIKKSNKITVHHLLLHISGLPNEKDEIYAQPKSPEAFVMETTSEKGKNFGSFNYANIDYVLLGLIIEKYDGKSWQQSVQHRILNKLHMNSTGFLAINNYPEDFAYSFSYDQNDNRQADKLFFIENYYAAGSMYSNVKDLLKLDQAMYGNQLLSDKSKTSMYTSYPEYNYSGYSVWTYNYPFANSKPKIMERRGGILGANSVLIRMLDTNKTLIILSNNNKFNPDSFGNTKSLKEALMIKMDE